MATLTNYNLSINALNQNALNAITKPQQLTEQNLKLKTNADDIENIYKNIKPNIKCNVDIYEKSTRANTEETAPTETTTDINPTKELIRFLINRNRTDANRLNLKHFKNIRCKDNNNKSCIIPIYKPPTDTEAIKHIEESENDLIITTNNKCYVVFIRDIYNIHYTNLLNRMAKRYKMEVRPDNIIL